MTTPVIAAVPRWRTAVPRSNGCAAVAERLWKDGLAECTMDIACRISRSDVRVESAPRPVTHPASSKGRPLNSACPALRPRRLLGRKLDAGEDIRFA